MTKDTYCSYCGSVFKPQEYPKSCHVCGNEAYRNAVAVGIGIIPINNGILAVRRAKRPTGGLALPGGFKEVDESWQEGIAREIVEETGIYVNPNNIELAGCETARDGNVLVFGKLNYTLILPDPLPFVIDPEEVLEALLLYPNHEELCFPHHQKMVDQYWKDNTVKYLVTRSDDNGHTVLIQEGLSEAVANDLLEKLKRGHKQFYDKYAYTDPATKAKILLDKKVIV